MSNQKPWEDIPITEYVPGRPVYVNHEDVMHNGGFFATLEEACQYILDDDLQLDPEVICRVHPCSVGPVDTPDPADIWEYITEQWAQEFDDYPDDIEQCDTGSELLAAALLHIAHHAPEIWRPDLGQRIVIPEGLLT